MRTEWSDAGKASARRFMRDDQDGLRAVGLAVLALADDPSPAGAFHRGGYHRLRVGSYRILYFIDDDVIARRRMAALPPDVLAKRGHAFPLGHAPAVADAIPRASDAWPSYFDGKPPPNLAARQLLDRTVRRYRLACPGRMKRCARGSEHSAPGYPGSVLHCLCEARRHGEQGGGF
jgi:mRNA interferase RelE/StbE